MRRKILSITTAVCLTAATQGLNAQSSRAPRATARGTSATGSAAGLAPEGSEVNPSGQYSTQQLEEMRAQLMNLADAVEQTGALAPPNLVDMDSLRQARTQIQTMPYEHLNTLRKGISPSKLNARLTPARQQLKSYTDSIAQGRGTGA